MKKLVSLGLALVMCLALAIPAFASEEQFATENSSLVPTVEVELPASGVVILNPYKMSYTGDALDGLAKNAKDQILSNIFALTNKTQGANLKVKTTVTATAEGNVALEPKKAAIDAKDTANTVILKLTYGLVDTAAAKAPTTMSTKKADLQMTGEEQSLKDIVLGPSDGSKFTFIQFQFSGSANEKVETPWAESDTVGATFVFTFEPTTDAATTALSA